jgi:hypothetical protein
MISEETLSTLKFTFITLATATIILKVIRISRYNGKKDEPIDMNIFGRFSNMEIDGSYNAERKRVLVFCNRMTILLYLFLLLLVGVLVFPRIASNLGLV